jgi:hypothetical protein
MKHSSRGYGTASACADADHLPLAMNLPDRLEVRWQTLGRPLVGLVTAYALVIQIIAAAVGLQLAAVSGPGLAAELCLNGAQDAPAAPGHAPDHSGDQHCVLCFSSVSLALAVPGASAFRRVELQTSQVSWRINGTSLPPSRQYTIARPRGPPFSA